MVQTVLAPLHPGDIIVFVLDFSNPLHPVGFALSPDWVNICGADSVRAELDSAVFNACMNTNCN